MKNSHKSLFLLLIVFLLIRIPLIYFPLDLNLYDTAFSSTQKFIGMFALDLIHGLRLSVWDYLVDPYGGGHLLIAAWTVPFLKLFGENLFAVKLASLCWHFIAVILWYFVFRRHYSDRKTFFILLFLVLAPPQITNLFLHSYGYHNDMILWMALTLLVFQRFLDGKLSTVRAGLILGFLGGFSTWTVLTNLITVVLIWIYVALWRESKVCKWRFYLSYLPAFLIGMSLLVYHNYLTEWRIFEFVSRRFMKPVNSPWELLYNAMWMVRHSFRILLDPSFSSQFLRILFRDGYTVLYLFSLLYFLWMKRQELFRLQGPLNIEVFGFYFQIILLFLFVKGDALGTLRYLLPMVPFMGMTMVAVGEYMGDKFGLRWGHTYQSVLVVFCLLGGLLGTLKIFLTRYPEPPSTLFMKGYSYDYMHYALQDNYAPNSSVRRLKFKQFIRDLPPSVQEEMYRYFNYEFSIPQELPELLSFIHEAGEALYPMMYEKLGQELGEYYDHDGFDHFISLLDSSNISKEFYPYIFYGLAQRLDADQQQLLCQRVAKGDSIFGKFCRLNSRGFL